MDYLLQIYAMSKHGFPKQSFIRLKVTGDTGMLWNENGPWNQMILDWTSPLSLHSL